ncbi:hypothetical protein [Paracoccus sp. (in: a-proteobacteria)]|uniref:hypothetical protein n=1 Tax=Paracoccus sp. TaxID=267 RepID=UPI0026E1125C|nr:hypothetical protein [Paracoccus sp. (in: a-proteobacteria)]MDO5371541.1 hypothetical protein [Paracoccus sp. (in: a-proteobacteria)]
MTVHSITPAPKAGQPVSVAVVAAGPQRLASLLEPHLPAPAGRLVIFDAAGTAGITPTVPGAEVELIAAAIGDAEGETELIRHSLPGFLSLRRAAETLHEIFPGLHEVARRSVPVVPVTAVAGRLGAAVFTLILDLPGEELALLSRLERHGLLERVQKLTLRCGAERFFEEAMTADELQEWLAERGFNLTRRDERDSAWPVLHFTADHLRRRVTALERDLFERDAALDKAEAKASRIIRRLQAAEAELQTARTVAEKTQKGLVERDAALDKTTVEAAGIAKRLQTAEAQLHAVQITAEAAKKGLAERDVALEKAKSEAAGIAKRLQTTEGQLQALQITAKTAQKRLAERDAALDKAQAEADGMVKRLQAAEAELQTARTSAETAQKGLAERDKALDKAKAEAAEMARRLQTTEGQLQAVQTTTETAQKSLAERDAALEKARFEAVGMASRLQAVEAELQTARTTAETAQKTIADRDAALGKAEADAAGTAKRLQALADETRRLRLALRNSEELAQRARAGFDEMRADHGMLLSMLQARTDELAALQVSHQRLSDDKRAVEELLGKLTPRLQEAAAQLGSLALLPGEPPAEASAEQGRREWPRKLRGRDQ